MNISKVFLLAILFAISTVAFSSVATAVEFGSIKVSPPRVSSHKSIRKPVKNRFPTNPGYDGPGSQIIRTRRIKNSRDNRRGGLITYRNPYGFSQGLAYGYRSNNGYTGSVYRGYGSRFGPGVQVSGTVDKYGRPREINSYGRTPLNHRTLSRRTRLPY